MVLRKTLEHKNNFEKIINKTKHKKTTEPLRFDQNYTEAKNNLLYNSLKISQEDEI